MSITRRSCLPLLVALSLSWPGYAGEHGQGQKVSQEVEDSGTIIPPSAPTQELTPAATSQGGDQASLIISDPVLVAPVSGGASSSPTENVAPPTAVEISLVESSTTTSDPEDGDGNAAESKGEPASKREPVTVVETKVLPPKVSIATEAELSFGLARFKRGHSGWVVVDPGGGYSASPGIAFSARSLPLPGLIRVKAPPESLLQLRLDFEDGAGQGYTSKDGVSLRQVTLGRGMQQLPRRGFLWELRMPRGDSETVETVIAIGGELQFSPWEGGRTFSKKLLVDCVSVELRR